MTKQHKVLNRLIPQLVGHIASLAVKMVYLKTITRATLLTGSTGTNFAVVGTDIPTFYSAPSAQGVTSCANLHAEQPKTLTNRSVVGLGKEGDVSGFRGAFEVEVLDPWPLVGRNNLDTSLTYKYPSNPLLYQSDMQQRNRPCHSSHR